ncbi:hypothetical protein CYY_000579 [Polysphondylium violaceum]|uniref:Alpha-methylacyl-CoA racemase n=1 Tax=Polysphondylium violaceum TaxID=133409 RepID=A0A8J4PZI6_9MYCE|nr:hypothetical protein CYY_000579 [Polysphondylium violaceum]
MYTPLKGVVVIEMGGLAPVPFCGMVLRDFGARVIRVDRMVEGVVSYSVTDQLDRGKESIALDLKRQQGKELLLGLVDKADVLLDPFRPGVLEKLGLAPSVLQQRNPRLIIARLTGYGQLDSKNPYAKMAGHDINYISLSGSLGLFGGGGNGTLSSPPSFPVNLLGDFAGGGQACAMGILLALLERSSTGKGRVIDCAMVDNAAYLTSFVYNLKKRNMFWTSSRGSNMLDGGAHFYQVYQTKDDKFVSVGCLEPQFYKQLLEGLKLDAGSLPDQNDASEWPAMIKLFQGIFKTKTRDEWESVFINTDACVTPVLELEELSTHPYCKSRNLIVTDSLGNQSITRPFSSAPNSFTPPPPISTPGSDTIPVLQEFCCLSSTQISDLASHHIIPLENNTRLHAKL